MGVSLHPLRQILFDLGPRRCAVHGFLTVEADTVGLDRQRLTPRLAGAGKQPKNSRVPSRQCDKVTVGPTLFSWAETTFATWPVSTQTVSSTHKSSLWIISGSHCVVFFPSHDFPQSVP